MKDFLLSIKFIITISVLFFFTGSAYSLVRIDSLDSPTSLEGEWEIKLESDKIHASRGSDGSDWDKIMLPGDLGQYIFERTGKLPDTVVWVRKKVFISKELKDIDFGIALGRIATADVTYLNGVRIGSLGSFPPNDFSMWNHPRHYNVPLNVVKYGEENLISIRVYSKMFSEIRGTLAIGNYEIWYLHKVWQNFSFVIMNYLIIFMGIPFFFIFLIIYLNRREPEYLYGALQLICGFFLILELCNYWNMYGNTIFRLKILGANWVFISVLHPLFLHRLHKFHRKKIEIALLAYMLICLTFIFFLSGNISELPMIRLLIISCTVIGFYNLSCHITALVKKRPYVQLYVYFFIILILGGIHDGFAYFLKFIYTDISLFNYNFDIMIFGYTVVGLYIATTVIIVTRFLNSKKEVLDLYSSLEEYIYENILLSEEVKKSKTKKNSTELSIRAEEKMKKIMVFIRENYKFDVSREGLAASIDMHPDNFSRIFKKYTQKRLSEFTHELRINDAVKKLTETDDKIIDIAFEVGFDCLRTFNRAFRKCMDMSPEKYRKHHRKQS